jgi:hypothetical protein
MKIVDAFEKWLLEQGYQPSTAQSTVRMVKRAEKAWRDGERIESYVPYLRRLVTFRDQTGVREEFIDAVAETFAPVQAAPTGSHEKPPLTEEQWRAFVATLNPSDPYDVALSILIRAPDPANELQKLLQAPLKELEQQDIPASARKRVRELRSEGVSSLLKWVCPGGSYDCAYKRLFRRLVTRGRELELEIDFHSIGRVPWGIRSA